MSNLKEDRELMAQKFMTNFSKLYKELLTKCGISQKRLSELSGIDEATINKMRRMVSPNLSWYGIYKIAKLLDITVDSIVDGNYDINKIKDHLIKTAKINKK